jgi:hypothetical protein
MEETKETIRYDLGEAIHNLFWKTDRAVDNLNQFLVTLWANANCLKHIKGNSCFHGLNVDNTLNPLNKQLADLRRLVEELYKDNEATNAMTTIDLEHHLKRMKYNLSQVYRLRRNLTSFCKVVGIPTRQMNASALLDYSNRNSR